MDIYGAHTAERVCFHILVQQFIGIQFWTVGRQKENPDLLTRRSASQRLTKRALCTWCPSTMREYVSPGLARQAQRAGQENSGTPVP